MHAGNIFSSLVAWLVAKLQGGEVVLRIEDLDRERSKPEYAEQILYDYAMLGLTWDRGPYYQHKRAAVYSDYFEQLRTTSQVYPCFCTRADLHAARAPHAGESPVYTGTCRRLSGPQRAAFLAEGRRHSYRVAVPDEVLCLDDLFQGHFCENLATECGDFIIKRADGSFAYQLAVVIDDADQGVTSVVRGVDLLSSTPQQMYLQQAFGFCEPHYGHVPLLVDESGRRLSKRNEDAEMDVLLARFGSPAGIVGHIAFVTGLTEYDEPVTPDELLHNLTLSRLCTALGSRKAIQFS